MLGPILYTVYIMTTKRKCIDGAKKIRKSVDFVIIHTPGHVDQTKVGTDRGFTLLPIDEVWNFGAEIDAYYTSGGQPLNTELMKARTRSANK
jgi:hypothetical protein